MARQRASRSGDGDELVCPIGTTDVGSSEVVGVADANDIDGGGGAVGAAGDGVSAWPVRSPA